MKASADLEFRVDRDYDDGIWLVEQTILDGEDENDWVLSLHVDIKASRTRQEPVMNICGFGP
jgi:hypothetical protein